MKLAFKATWIWMFGFGRQDVLQSDLVFPVVPEIVDVDRFRANIGQNGIEPHTALIFRHRPANERIFHVRSPKSSFPDPKLMQMGILPSRDGLQDIV